MTSVLQVLVLGLLLGLVYTLAGLGMTLSLGVLKVLNLTHGMAVLGGSVLAYQLHNALGLSPLVSALVALPAFFAVGCLLHAGLVRRAQAVSAESGLLVLFGAMTLLQAATAQFWSGDIRTLSADYSNASVRLGGILVPSDYLVAGLGAAVLLVVVGSYLRWSTTGRAVQALAQHPDAARILGVPVERYATLVFGAATAVAGSSGALLATVVPFSVATQTVWLTYAFIVVLVGGTGGVRGALVGGLALGIGQAVFNYLLPLTWVSIVVYGLLLVAMVVRGGGLASVRERAL
ncbi:branched-chain amino acid ABC transporter permease [Pseudonocardia sp. RS010]|uniref:branched-chain amino acid ABC transporter permease n=1 Tax=Pseudonocardia sp. RS010 TaxID=3385979 RepID=UPI0039A0A93D